ncbi:MAG: ATP-NAD kinase family protein [Shewanella sp.]|nr:ATP-NAD kinase family protein [Shewanella sp.]MCF1430198.1 ATP-NAD kinase family protein [Shewanella sp.]MCF1439975.1 ATP-NAD kinase family protein [Shewanella sp.]MCF1458995.1 ATP-NAD kinase family protein [Shewanella sp.]
MKDRRFQLGLLINPFAGLGGSVALKGSDRVAQLALEKGAQPRAQERMRSALEVLLPFKDHIEIHTGSGLLGETLAREMGFDTQVWHQSAEPSTDEDTNALVRVLAQQLKPDLLLFAGGDGTARDILSTVGNALPVLGVPAGVKIHSGVYAITPLAAGLVIKMLLNGELVSLMTADVMDIDEVAFREGVVRARRFGEMMVPAEPRYVQAVKMGGREVDELVLADIAADVIEQMDDELYIMGSGSTVAAIMEELRLDNTLLGVDLIRDKQLLGRDLTASELLAQTHQYTQIQAQLQNPKAQLKLVITLIGGQGHILGRGNQQLSPELIRRVSRDNIILVATKTKLKALEGRPLIVDSGDPLLDQELCGYYRVTTGFHDYVMYQVASPALD